MTATPRGADGVGVRQERRDVEVEIPEAYNLGRDRVRFGPVLALGAGPLGGWPGTRRELELERPATTTTVETRRDGA